MADDLAPWGSPEHIAELRDFPREIMARFVERAGKASPTFLAARLF